MFYDLPEDIQNRPQPSNKNINTGKNITINIKIL